MVYSGAPPRGSHFLRSLLSNPSPCLRRFHPFTVNSSVGKSKPGPEVVRWYDDGRAKTSRDVSQEGKILLKVRSAFVLGIQARIIDIEVELSGTFVPAKIAPNSKDKRTLGIAVRSICLLR